MKNNAKTTNMKPKQLQFGFASYSKEHGGSVAKGKRKQARPIIIKRPMHVVLRSPRAFGAHSLLSLRASRYIEDKLHELSKQFKVRVYEYANSGNHIHLLVKTETRKGFQAFLRTLAGLIARFVTGARKGNPMGKFWEALAYSRVVEWGVEFFKVRDYLILNQLETAGHVPYRIRDKGA